MEIKNTQTSSVLKTVAAVLFFIAALVHLITSIRNVSSFVYMIGSYYSTFADTFTSLLFFFSNIAAAAGLCISGLCLVMKNTKDILLKTIPLIIIIYCAFSAAGNLFHLISWGNGSYFFSILFNIVLALIWAALAMITFDIRTDLVRKFALGYILVPSVLAALELLTGISGGYFYSGLFLITTIVEYAALILVGVMVYIKYSDALNSNTYDTGETAAGSGSGQTSCGETPAYNTQTEPEVYTGIVKLVLLSIVTLGIYVYIWIYRVAGYTGKRSMQGPQCSQGVQVVLCLFVPFYIIYWLYKQCKAIEDIRLRTFGTGSEDLSLICLLLSIFGFGIVAYALMQDQLNKLIKPVPAAYAAASPDTASVTDAQIETVKKLKALLDAGILTQEEFEAKKKQVLGL